MSKVFQISKLAQTRDARKVHNIVFLYNRCNRAVYQVDTFTPCPLLSSFSLSLSPFLPPRLCKQTFKGTSSPLRTNLLKCIAWLTVILSIIGLALSCKHLQIAIFSEGLWVTSMERREGYRVLGVKGGIRTGHTGDPPGPHVVRYGWYMPKELTGAKGAQLLRQNSTGCISHLDLTGCGTRLEMSSDSAREPV